MSDIQVAEPTAEYCNYNGKWVLEDGRVGVACWYPQMGGYVSKCVIVPDEDGHFEAFVWHDGDFPFSGEDDIRADTNPRRIHHCDPTQFIAFGRLAERVIEQMG